jgi:hypothetical protein
LPAKPVRHGVSVGAGHVYVACEDGSIVCFDAESVDHDHESDALPE